MDQRLAPALGSSLVDVVSLLCGISLWIFVVIGPCNTISSCLVHANLNWTFGPLRRVISSPVFDHWHHAVDVCGTNFVGTFALWDLMFGTFHMPAHELPGNYGIADKEMPEGPMPQLYPIMQRDPVEQAV